MKKLFFFSVTIILAIHVMAQKPDETFTYSGDGLFFKVFKIGSGVAIPYGGYIEYSMEQSYDDSLLADTKERKLIMVIDSAVVPPSYFRALKGLNVGDSVVYKLATDSTMDMYASIPWVTKGHYFNTTFKIEKLFANKAEADAVVLKAQKEDAARDSIRNVAMMAIESKKIEQYLMQKGVQYIKSPTGLYYSISKRGVGPKPTKKSIVTVNYTGKTMEGKVFDSNTDPAFNHVQPYDVRLGTGTVIQGWDEGLQYFNKGATGNLYVPSPMAYGRSGNGPIAANEILIFDIEVVNIKGSATQPAAPAKIKKPVVKAKTPVKH